jgi:AhpD family alkylhydroperoxidase
MSMDGHYHDQAALEREDGSVPRKYRELIAIAVALTTQCVYCIESHTAAARRQGASQEELAETVFVAAALRAGGAVAHGRLAMKLFERAGEESKAPS